MKSRIGAADFVSIVIYTGPDGSYLEADHKFSQLSQHLQHKNMQQYRIYRQTKYANNLYMKQRI